MFGIISAQAFLEGGHIDKAETALALHGDETDKANQAQAPNLHENHTNHLTKGRVTFCHRLCEEPSHADHGNSCEEIVPVAGCRPLSLGNGQAQE